VQFSVDPAAVSPAGPLASHKIAVPGQHCLRGDGEALPRVARHQPARRRQQDPIAPPQRQATTSGKHAYLMAQDQDLKIASNIMGIAARSERR